VRRRDFDRSTRALSKLVSDAIGGGKLRPRERDLAVAERGAAPARLAIWPMALRRLRQWRSETRGLANQASKGDDDAEGALSQLPRRTSDRARAALRRHRPQLQRPRSLPLGNFTCARASERAADIVRHREYPEIWLRRPSTARVRTLRGPVEAFGQQTGRRAGPPSAVAVTACW
jgi:hypothetical protein